MARRLRKAERDIVQKIASVILELDRLVFPENPIKNIFVVLGWPEGESQGIGYVSPENAGSEGEHYQIYGYGLDERIKKEAEKRVILLRGQEKKRYEDMPRITLEEVMIGLAAHETRHRIQHRLPIRLLSPEISQDIDNPYVRKLIAFIKLLFEREPPRGDYKQEFDAKAIEFTVREMWHLGEREASKIVKIVSAEAARDLHPFDEA